MRVERRGTKVKKRHSSQSFEMSSRCGESACATFRLLSFRHRFREATIQNGLWQRPRVQVPTNGSGLVNFTLKRCPGVSVFGFGFRVSGFGVEFQGSGFGFWVLAVVVCVPPLRL